jgi:hypothetical protein
MTHFCAVIGCKTVKIDDNQAADWGGRCPVHGGLLRTSARPQDLQHEMPKDATPNVIDAVNGTLAQAKPMLTAPTLSRSEPEVRESSPTSSTASPSTRGSGQSTTYVYGALGDFACRHCGQKDGVAKHVSPLPENKQTRAKASAFVVACLLRDKNHEDALKGSKTERRGYMIGVLQHGSKFYVAASGKNKMPLGARRVANKQQLIVIDKLPLQLTMNRASIDTNGVTQTGIGGFFECAGPKLMGHILDSLRPSTPSPNWALTEMWLGPDKEGLHSHNNPYGSCGNCRIVMPMMLCQGVRASSTTSSTLTSKLVPQKGSDEKEKKQGERRW